MKFLIKSIWFGIAVVFINSFYPDYPNKNLINYIAFGIIIVSLYFNDTMNFNKRNK